MTLSRKPNAPSNGQFCSVLNPNSANDPACNKPGLGTKYATFLLCEFNNSIEQLTDEEDAQRPVAFTVVAMAVVGGLKKKAMAGWGLAGAVTGGIMFDAMA